MSSEPDSSSHILLAARLLLKRAPAADAADDVVEKWGRHVVKLLNGLEARQPEFLSLPEVLSVINLLQDLADARLRVAWLAWGGDWLPGTVIEQCISRLPPATATTNNDSTPASTPSPSQSSFNEVTTFPRVTARKATAPAPVSVAAHNLTPEEELDATSRVKRTTPNKALSSSERPTKRARYTTSVAPPRPTKGLSLVDKLDKYALSETRKVLHKCLSCKSRNKLCLTVTKKGVIQSCCVHCISGHSKCEWKKGHLEENFAYREESSSFYDLVGTAEPSEGATTCVSVPTVTPARTRPVINTPDHHVKAVIRPPCGPKSAITRRLSGSHTHVSPRPRPSATSPYRPLPSANATAILKPEMTVGAGDAQPARSEETLKVLPRPPFTSLVVGAAATDIADKARSMRYKAILESLRAVPKIKTEVNQVLGE
ncbi:hypothetical protein K503DRAFT_460978 [Rhizopogon vinicolor AM-OR11-026]|uniref:Uncharacterized protein n=1 Tax=Rhizopogon vinicolor AM-OR11-026 TaxID=1314800 RepID=A0A1B7MNQ6_9AGAM|nr:hypothetical protein K503DRAFT_460978 [Rhizopogon vinicolor AM-OR11-026]